MIETLLRINIPSTQDLQYLPHEQGVYFARFTKPEAGYGPYYSQWSDTGINTQRVTVGSVFVDLESYPRKSSLADCEADDKSFFWDDGAQTLYIHFEFDDIPEITSIVIGLQNGYSFIGTPESIYISDVEYQPRIKTVPNIKKKVDKLQVGKMAFKDQKIVLNNGDGALDDFIQNPIPGAEGSIVLLDTSNLSELSYFTGIVSSDTSTIDTLTITLEDKRRRENLKIPRGRYDATTYADIESKYVGKIIPEGYGVNIGVPCTPLNGTVGSGNIEFKYATDGTVLTDVRVKEDDVWDDTVTALNSNPSAGYFELSYAEATNASGAVLECVADVTLRTTDDPGGVISDMNNRYLSIAFDATSYDLTEWAAEKVKLSDISLYMNKEKEFFKWVEDLQNGTNLFFKYDIDGEGKRTLRVNDPDRSVSRTIPYYSIKDDKKTVERDFSEFSSTVTVLYSHDWQFDTDDRIEVDTYEAAVLEKYRFPQDSEFVSLLPSSVGAQEKADVIAEDQSESRPVVTVILHENSLSDLDLKIYDVVNVATSLPEATYWEDVPDEIYFDYGATDETYFDYSATDEVFFSIGKTVVSEEGREYWGTIRGQVIGINYNPSDLSYTLTIRERPGVDPEGEDFMPIGAVYWWPGAGVLPATAKLCDGTVYNIVDYPDLGALLSDTWGGNGTTTFAVPNLQGIYPGALGTQTISTRTKGDGTAVVGDYVEDQGQGHWHESWENSGVNDGKSRNYDGAAGNDARDDAASTEVVSQGVSIGDAAADATNGTPRTGTHTDVSRAIGKWLIQAV